MHQLKLCFWNVKERIVLHLNLPTIRIAKVIETGYFVLSSICTVDWLLQTELSDKWSWDNSWLTVSGRRGVFYIKHVTKFAGEVKDPELQVSQAKPHSRWFHSEVLLLLRLGLLCWHLCMYSRVMWEHLSCGGLGLDCRSDCSCVVVLLDDPSWKGEENGGEKMNMYGLIGLSKMSNLTTARLCLLLRARGGLARILWVMPLLLRA